MTPSSTIFQLASIQNMTPVSMKSNDSMPPMSVKSDDSSVTPMRVTKEDLGDADRPSFKKGLESITSSLAKEMNQLSLAERENVYYDLHGVSDVVEETPGFVDQCLSDLESEICKLEDKKKNAYEMAKKVNPGYICGRTFRLKFLRAECFVPKDAAARLVGFLEVKLKLFGPKPIARELLLSDLNQDDIVVIRSGFLSIVPLRDSAGRALTVVVPFFRPEATLEIRMRVFLYLLSVLAQDEETQMKGCVGLLFNMHPFRRPMDPEDAVHLTNLMINLAPIRYVGHHFCYDEPQPSMISNLESALSSVHQLNRVRIRVYSGSLLDVHYDLMTFGIPTKVLPVTAQGEAVWQYHDDWISSRKSIEANNLAAKEEHNTTPSFETNQNDCIDVPRTVDVLIGTEQLAQSHTGNTRYQFLIDEYLVRYDACETRIEKTIIASAIVMKVKDYDGRFLIRKKGETNWSEADDWVAREKVTTAFRGRRKSAIARLKRTAAEGTDTGLSKRQLPDVFQPYPASNEFAKNSAEDDFDWF